MRFAEVPIATGPRLHYAEQGDAGRRSGCVSARMAGLVVLVQQGRRADTDELPRAARRPARVRRVGSSARVVTASVTWRQMSLPSSMRSRSSAQRSSGTRSAASLPAASPSTIRSASIAWCSSARGWLGSNEVTREVHASLRDLADPVPREFAREFQASTAFAPLPEAFFEQIVTESLKLPARLWAELLGSVITYDDVGRAWGDRCADAIAVGRPGRAVSEGGSGAFRCSCSSGTAANLSGDRPLSQLGMPGRGRARHRDVSPPRPCQERIVSAVAEPLCHMKEE